MDESKRSGNDLGSFKALGAPYLVYQLLAGKVHGRGLAYGANIFGGRCVTYIDNHVSDGRAKRMIDLDPMAKEDARMNGWHFVSSTSWTDFGGDTPQHVVNGCMVVVEETLTLIPNDHHITHVFVCGGVGSIAVAIFQGFHTLLHRFIVVETSEAGCLLQNAKDGEVRPLQGSLCTVMVELPCRDTSPAAWKILAWVANDFLSVPDSAATEGMTTLAGAYEGDIPVVCGESSAVSMDIMLASSAEPFLRQILGLDSDSQALHFGLEGATDPEIYDFLLSESPATIFEAQDRFIAKNEVSTSSSWERCRELISYPGGSSHTHSY
ncbi:tryptophan synthase beta subunit-like PLP-dependent enzyme [Xylariaceae sp. FL1019]|nr:tryptophan synthase beta subunit-like PLP-dependent enzyme [Xylariaceae sp. FL1019]